MPEFEDHIDVAADGDSAFAFCSDVARLPDYLPTLTSVEWKNDDVIRMCGNAHGHTYDTEGTLHVHNERLRMEWSARADAEYEGWLQVEPLDDAHARVTVHLSFTADARSREAMARRGVNPDDEIRGGLRRSLETLKRLMEEEPTAAWRIRHTAARPEDDDLTRGYDQPRHGFRQRLR